MLNRLGWLFLSEQGLLWRIAGGVLILVLLAGWDLRRKGRQATRWKEYLFLLAAVAAAMAYGVANDQITCTISWEYFYLHDEQMAAALGDRLPPDEATLRWEAIKLGMKATWTAGLLIGVALLLANNPHKRLPRLSYRRLTAQALLPLATAAALGVLGGLAGWLWSREGACALWVGQTVRPGRLLAVWGVHLGGYAGGAIGAVLAVWRIRRLRGRLLRAATAPRTASDAGASASNDPPPANRIPK